MKRKRWNLYISLIILVLVSGIFILSKNILNNEDKEVKVAKEFIELLIDKGIIDENKENLKGEEYLNQATIKISKIQYSVILGNYGIDIDNKFNVVGFSNKNLQSNNKDNITEEKAINLAETYINEISDSEILFKEVKDEEDSSHYSVIFYKAKDGYPIYRQEITMVINKTSGKLESYSNSNIENKTYVDELKYNEKEIKELMNEYFVSINKNVSNISDGSLAYVLNNNDEYVLSYIFNVISEPDKVLVDNSQANADISLSRTVYNEEVEEKNEINQEKNDEILILRADNGEFINLDTSIINK